MNTAHRQQGPDGAAKRREHDALAEQLADNSSTTSPEGQTNRDLAVPCRAARQQQTRDVCTDNPQHDAHRDGQGAKCRPARRDGLLLDALHIEATDPGRKGLRQWTRGRFGTQRFADDIGFIRRSRR